MAKVTSEDFIIVNFEFFKKKTPVPISFRTEITLEKLGCQAVVFTMLPTGGFRTEDLVYELRILLIKFDDTKATTPQTIHSGNLIEDLKRQFSITTKQLPEGKTIFVAKNTDKDAAEIAHGKAIGVLEKY